jgi:hypothetical protein
MHSNIGFELFHAPNCIPASELTKEAPQIRGAFSSLCTALFYFRVVKVTGVAEWTIIDNELAIGSPLRPGAPIRIGLLVVALILIIILNDR